MVFVNVYCVTTARLCCGDQRTPLHASSRKPLITNLQSNCQIFVLNWDRGGRGVFEGLRVFYLSFFILHTFLVFIIMYFINIHSESRVHSLYIYNYCYNYYCSVCKGCSNKESLTLLDCAKYWNLFFGDDFNCLTSQLYFSSCTLSSIFPNLYSVCQEICSLTSHSPC